MFENVSIEELQTELERREKIRDRTEKPTQLKHVNLYLLRKICQEYIDELDNEGFADDNYEHSIYETALECIFGKNVWDWINKKDAS